MLERYMGLTAQQMEEHLYADIQSALCNRYGPDPDARVRKRVEEEWAAIKRTGMVTTVAFCKRLYLGPDRSMFQFRYIREEV